MGGYNSWIFWIIFGILTDGIHGKNCSKALDSCLRCDVTGSKCVKCRHSIVVGSRDCVESCPMGYTQQWSTYNDYMGRVCVETSFIQSIGVSGQTFAVLVGAATGVILCLGALLGGCIYVRRRRIKALAGVDESSDSTLTVTPLHQHERGEFIREVSLLRHEAPVFLSMLNETRRQVREIYKSKTSNHRREAAAYAYRPVLRDLYIILVLLNKPEDKITTPPPDWQKLLSWGERVLKRYKRQHNITTPIGELVSFLQPEQRNFSGSRGSLFHPYSTLSTVSTNTLTSTVSRKQKNNLNNNKNEAVQVNHSRRESILDLNDGYGDGHTIFQNPPTVDEANGRSLNRFSIGEREFEGWDDNRIILAEWSASRERLFEEDFIRLGFRPQDEITTEL